MQRRHTPTIQYKSPPLLLAICALLFTGCSSMILRDASLRNLTQHNISNVHIIHIPSQHIAENISVKKEASCNLNLNNRPLQGKQALLKWTQSNGKKYVTQISLPTKRDVEFPKQPHLLIYRILPDGKASAQLEP